MQNLYGCFFSLPLKALGETSTTPISTLESSRSCRIMYTEKEEHLDPIKSRWEVHWILELSFNSMGFWLEVDPLWFLTGSFAYEFLSTCGAHVKAVFEFEWRATYFRSLRTKTHFYTSWNTKLSRPSLNWYRMFFAQPPHYLQACTKQLTKHERCRMQKNQLLTKSPVKVMVTLLASPF